MILLKHAYICCHGQYGHALEDGLPCADILSLLRDHSAELGRDLPGVDPDLKQVVDESQDGSQGEGGDEQGDKPELDHCQKVNTHDAEISSEQSRVCLSGIHYNNTHTHTPVITLK